MENEFIKQTSLDYDMEYSEVERIYYIAKEHGDFYGRLEEYIKNRADN
jgi:hypothetical protein